MHTIDARAAGETEQRLYLLDAWREAPFYSDRERAALAWTEAVTLVSETHVMVGSYDRQPLISPISRIGEPGPTLHQVPYLTTEGAKS